MIRFSLVLVLLACQLTSLHAKWVKFAVDMTGQTINPTGVHVMGDFQAVAGFPNGDWQPNTTSMLQESADTNIYSVLVNIPAFRKYEYRFINGDQSYETEFIPIPSRVGYDFIDNRWLYVDSLQDDTTFIGAILFGGNAPKNLFLMRHIVDMSYAGTVAPEGVHLVGDFQGWNAQSTYMYSFIDNIYEVISFDTLGTKSFRYINGESWANLETINDGNCTFNNDRVLELTTDSVLPVVCFNSCSACAASIANKDEQLLSAFPNPATDHIQLNIEPGQYAWKWIDITGRCIAQEKRSVSGPLSIDCSDIPRGTYLIQWLNLQTESTHSIRVVLE